MNFFAPGAKMPYSSENFSGKDIEKFYALAYKFFYLRPKIILKQILRLRTIEDVKRNFIGAKWILSKGVLGTS